MRLHLRVRAVERVPRSAPPAAERDAIGSQRRAVGVLDEPVADAAGRRATLLPRRTARPRSPARNRAAGSASSTVAHVAAERRAGVEPVAHRASDSRRRSGRTSARECFSRSTSRLSSTCCAVTRGPKQYHEHQPVGGSSSLSAADDAPRDGRPHQRADGRSVDARGDRRARRAASARSARVRSLSPCSSCPGLRRVPRRTVRSYRCRRLVARR